MEKREDIHEDAKLNELRKVTGAGNYQSSLFPIEVVEQIVLHFTNIGQEMVKVNTLAGVAHHEKSMKKVIEMKKVTSDM